MTDQTLIEIEEIDAFGEGVPDEPSTPSSSGTGGSFRDLSLPQIRSREGDFLIPSQLPR